MILIHRFLCLLIANEDTAGYHEYIVIWSFIYLFTLYLYFSYMKKNLKLGLVLASMTSPMFAFAQTPLEDTLGTFSDIIDFLIPVMLSLAVLVFFWGLVKYIANASDEAAKESGKTLMIWGMVAMFVMVAFWGIIGYVQQSLGLSEEVEITAPPEFDVIPT